MSVCAKLPNVGRPDDAKFDVCEPLKAPPDGAGWAPNGLEKAAPEPKPLLVAEEPNTGLLPNTGGLLKAGLAPNAVLDPKVGALPNPPTELCAV